MAQCHTHLLSARDRPPRVLGSGREQGHGTRENVRPALPAVCPRRQGAGEAVCCPVEVACCAPNPEEARVTGHSLPGRSVLKFTRRGHIPPWVAPPPRPAARRRAQGQRRPREGVPAQPQARWSPPTRSSRLRAPCPPLLEGTAPPRLPHAPASLPSACHSLPGSPRPAGAQISCDETRPRGGRGGLLVVSIFRSGPRPLAWKGTPAVLFSCCAVSVAAGTRAVSAPNGGTTRLPRTGACGGRSACARPAR